MCAPMLPWVARMQKPALLHSFFLPFLFLSGFLLFKDSPLHLQLCLLFLWMALCVGCCLLLGFLPSCPAHNGPGAPLCLPPAPNCPWIPRGLCRKFPVFTPARTSPLGDEESGAFLWTPSATSATVCPYKKRTPGLLQVEFAFNSQMEKKL